MHMAFRSPVCPLHSPMSLQHTSTRQNALGICPALVSQPACITTTTSRYVTFSCHPPGETVRSARQDARVCAHLGTNGRRWGCKAEGKGPQLAPQSPKQQHFLLPGHPAHISICNTAATHTIVSICQTPDVRWHSKITRIARCETLTGKGIGNFLAGDPGSGRRPESYSGGLNLHRIGHDARGQHP